MTPPSSEGSTYTGYAFLGPDNPGYVEGAVTWTYMDNGQYDIDSVKVFEAIDDWYAYVKSPRSGLDQDWMKEQACWTFCGGDTEGFDEALFWDVQALIGLCWDSDPDFATVVETVEGAGIIGLEHAGLDPKFDSNVNTVYWNRNMWCFEGMAMEAAEDNTFRQWHMVPPLAILAHEIAHAYDYVMDICGTKPRGLNWARRLNEEVYAMEWENIARYAFFSKVAGYKWVKPRPAYGWSIWNPPPEGYP